MTLTMRACPACRTTFAWPVPGTPHQKCPNGACGQPLTRAAADEMYPDPRPNDPNVDAKRVRREQVLTDLAAFEGA